MHIYKEIEQADGSVKVREFRDDGRRRWVDPDYAPYVAAKAKGENVEFAKYFAPEPQPAPTEAEIALTALQRTDQNMSRITEDLVDVLVAKGIIALADLPESARGKLENRKELRSKIITL